MAIIYGNSNPNHLIGTAQADDIRGYEGDDILDGGGGNDQMRGGLGNDVYITDGGDTLIESANQGIDEVRSSVSMTLGSTFENLVLTGSAALNGSGNAQNNVLTGNAGNNVLQGHGGHDEFIVSAGIDAIHGGDGPDAVLFGATAAASIDLAAGTYFISTSQRGTISSVSHAVGSPFADTIVGNGEVNHLSGGAGDDVMRGGPGNDQIWGGPGSDRLIADAGSDTLVGNSDTLGTLTDAAANIFEVRTAAGNVTIADFQPGVDKIDLTAFGFDQNGVSPDWTASGSYGPSAALLSLSGPNGAQVCITLNGVVQGLTPADLIGGTPALIPGATIYPVNGGNGVADVFVIDPMAIILQHGGVLDIVGFEDGLDRIDLGALDLDNPSYWDGWFYDYGPNDQTRLEFRGLGGEFFAVNLVGHSYFQADPTDFIL